MKKLMFSAALAAMAFGAVADGKAPEAAAEAPKAAEAAKSERVRPAFDRAKFEERMNQMRAERTEKVVAAIKAAGITDEAKAKELAETIDKLYSRPRRQMRPRQTRQRGGKGGERPAAQN